MHKARRGGQLRLTVTLSLLAAIGIILGKFLAFNVTEFMRFSLENTTIIFSGVIYGPMIGFAVGAVQDIVGCIAVGYTINPIITLGSASVGLVSGLTFRLVGRAPMPFRISLSVLTAHTVGSVLIKSVGLSVFYSYPLLVTVLWRILNYAIVGAAEAFILCMLLKSKPLLTQISKTVGVKDLAGFKCASDASTYARSVSGVFSKPGLERVEALLGALGHPERDLGIVHVTGTNGKGSFCALLTSVLKESGLRVGTFNSPYLYEMRESIRLGGEPITEGELLGLVNRLRPIADVMTDKPTEFELLTAAAYLCFKEARVDVAVVECGMGGGRDATNVTPSSLLSVITGVSIDHTSYLGDTTKEIARHKAGIIKKGCPVLVGGCDASALDVILDTASALNAPVTRCDAPAEALETSLDGSLISTDGVDGIHLPLLGVHQLYNAALAVRAANMLRDTFHGITDKSIRDGIAKTRWSGRFEILSREPLFIFDGAHNLDGIRSAVQSIRTYIGGKVICISGVLADKEYEAMADELATVVSHAVTVTPDSPRAILADKYAAVLSERGIVATAAADVKDGVIEAIKLSRSESAAIVCLGSLYLYRDIKDALDAAKTRNFDN